MQVVTRQIDTLVEKALRMQSLLSTLMQERAEMQDRILELEEEVLHYKAQIAQKEAQQVSAFSTQEKIKLKSTIESYLKEIDICLKHFGE
jgi:hypothetical protein